VRPERRIDLPFAGVVLGVGALLQSALDPSLLGGRVQLVLLLVVVWSIWRELDEAVVWGLLGGAVVDVFSAGPFGASVLALGIVALVASSLGDLLRRYRLVALLVVAPVCTAVFSLALGLTLGRLGWHVDYPAMVALVLLPSCLANTVAAPLVYLALRAVGARLSPAPRPY
jgi:rod shape-determining protein MreD